MLIKKFNEKKFENINISFDIDPDVYDFVNDRIYEAVGNFKMPVEDIIIQYLKDHLNIHMGSDMEITSWLENNIDDILDYEE